MKILDFKNFRDYYLKPAIIDIEKNIKQLQNEEKLEDFDLKKYKNIYGIIFISDSVCIKLIQLDNDIIKNQTIVIKNIAEKLLDFEIISESKIDNFDLHKKDLEFKFNVDNIKDLRELKQIDKLRNKMNPDIVEAVLFTDNKYMEILNVKLIMKTDMENIFAGIVLQDSKYDKQIKNNTPIALKYIFQDDEPYLIIGGIVSFFED